LLSKREKVQVRDFFLYRSVDSTENYPPLRLLTLDLSSIEEEKRRTPQATLNTHPGEGITSLYENISVRFSFSVRLVNERCRSAVDVPWQRRAHRHLPGRRAARVPLREVEISDRSARRRLAGDARQGHLLRK